MSRAKLLKLIAIWIGFVFALLPVFFQWDPLRGPAGHRARLQLDGAYLLGLILAGFLYKIEARRGSRQQAFAIVLLIVLATAWTNSVHRYYVDRGAVAADQSNLAWQLDTHRQALLLSPSVAPHSYRILPNAIVRWMELAGMDYESARDVYRLFTNLLLFYAVFRYARLFTNYGSAAFSLLLIASIYPVSFEYYAGQLTDPLSHLSFVLAFIFLELEEFGFFLTTILIGSLAKETVLSLAGYHLLFQRRDRRSLLKAFAACVASAAGYVGVRAFVMRGAAGYHYEQISGVSPEHVFQNLGNGRWQGPFLLTAVALLPFLIAGWKQTPWSLKRLTLFLLPVLFVSNLFFGWLFEARNYMPVVFVMAVATGRYLNALVQDQTYSKIREK